MRTQSVIAAVQAKVAGLAVANFPGGVRPAVYFEEAPPVTTTGAQLHVDATGYVVVRHRDTRSRSYSFDGSTREDTDLELEVFYPSLGDCRTAVNALRFNGGVPTNRYGLDYGTLPALDRNLRLLAVRPTGDRPGREQLGRTGQPVHSWTLSYRIEIVRLAGGA